MRLTVNLQCGTRWDTQPGCGPQLCHLQLCGLGISPNLSVLRCPEESNGNNLDPIALV